MGQEVRWVLKAHGWVDTYVKHRVTLPLSQIRFHQIPRLLSIAEMLLELSLRTRRLPGLMVYP